MTAQELLARLQSIQPGSVLCHYSLETCERLVPMIDEINRLKKERNAVILAHSYVAPEIVFGVADYDGDSYKLSQDATRVDADLIMFVAVEFMGETAQILNPGKTVIVPGSNPGCSLADSITGEQVRALRAQYPDYTFVCYINTTADVKAECDVCVTSANVVDIVAALPNDKICFLPDKLMGQNLQGELEKRGIHKQFVFHDGVCYVHEQYDPEMIEFFRMQNPGLRVVSHPECHPGVALLSDFVGSTGQMLDYIRKAPDSDPVLLLTECGLNARLQSELPHRHFIGSCSMCRYMKSNTLEGILAALRDPSKARKVSLSPDVMDRARGCIENMFRYAEATRK